MAERRMFSKVIMESDKFFELSDKDKLLYLYLNLAADDDGFIGSAKKILLFTETTKENLQELIDAGYIIQFSTGVCVITHWNAHNYIRMDRYHPTLFRDEIAQLKFDKGSRTYITVDQWYTNGSPNSSRMVDADKIRLVKTRKDKASLVETSEDESQCDFQEEEYEYEEGA